MAYDFKKATYCGECDCGCVEIKQTDDRVYVRSTFKKDVVVDLLLMSGKFL